LWSISYRRASGFGSLITPFSLLLTYLEGCLLARALPRASRQAVRSPRDRSYRPKMQNPHLGHRAATRREAGVHLFVNAPPSQGGRSVFTHRTPHSVTRDASGSLVGRPTATWRGASGSLCQALCQAGSPAGRTDLIGDVCALCITSAGPCGVVV
jgi:hypothetical protein